jgi:hypothetical protein
MEEDYEITMEEVRETLKKMVRTGEVLVSYDENGEPLYRLNPEYHKNIGLIYTLVGSQN